MQTGKVTTARAQLTAVPADLRERLSVSDLKEAARIAPGKVRAAISAARALLPRGRRQQDDLDAFGERDHRL